MKSSAFFLMAMLTLLGFVVPSLAASPRSAIEAANASFAALIAKGDSAGVAKLYAKNGAVMPPGSESIKGSEAIARYWGGALASGVAGVDFKTVEVYGQGKTATEVGEYTLRDKAGKTLDHGKYIVIWRQEDGEWKLLRDMFSSNAPPPKG